MKINRTLGLLGLFICAFLFMSCGAAEDTALTEEILPENQEEVLVKTKDSEAEESFVNALMAAKDYNKIIIVHTENAETSYGTLDYYLKTGETFELVLSVDCYVGEEGIGDASEYSTKTPAGRFTFTKLFGIAEDPGTLMEYHVLDDNDYWCGETYYNEFVDEDVQEHGCSKKQDEHLAGAVDAYQYVAAFNYNEENIPGEGFAFFLHNKNEYDFTEGCVSVDIEDMKFLETIIDENTCMIIDLDENLENY